MTNTSASQEIPVRIKNARGLILAGILHVPEGAGRCPAVLHLHGFTGYKEEENNVELARALAREGFVVLRFDASGDGESEGSLEHDYRITNYLKDIDTAYAFLCSQPSVDSHRIGIWGHSMGAMLAIIWGSKHPQIKAICSVSAPVQMGTTDWLGQFLDSWKRTGWFTKVSTSGRGAKKIPWAFMEDARKYNSLDFVRRVTSPLMIILGLAEDTVSPAHTREIYLKANEPKELVEVRGMSHDYKKNMKHIQFVNSKIVPFFENYLRNEREIFC